MKKCSVQLVKIQCTEISTQIKTITENNSHTGMKEQTSTLSVKRYQTRSSVFEKQNTERVDEKKAILQKPVFIKYKGRIEYHTELHDIAFHSDQLLLVIFIRYEFIYLLVIHKLQIFFYIETGLINKLPTKLSP